MIETIGVFIILAVLVGFPIYAINMWTGPRRSLPLWKRIIGYACGLWVLAWIVGPLILDWTGLVPW